MANCCSIVSLKAHNFFNEYAHRFTFKFLFIQIVSFFVLYFICNCRIVAFQTILRSLLRSFIITRIASSCVIFHCDCSQFFHSGNICPTLRFRVFTCFTTKESEISLCFHDESTARGITKFIRISGIVNDTKLWRMGTDTRRYCAYVYGLNKDTSIFTLLRQGYTCCTSSQANGTRFARDKSRLCLLGQG